MGVRVHLRQQSGEHEQYYANMTSEDKLDRITDHEEIRVRHEEIYHNPEDPEYVDRRKVIIDEPIPHDYNTAINKPKINGVELIGNKSWEDLGLKYVETYLHRQRIKSDEWYINHNLDKYPSVTIFDSAETELMGDVIYLDKNSLIIRFSVPCSGTATLN